MNSKVGLAIEISKCFKAFRQSKDDLFYDFTVEAMGDKFECHKFILGACSDFFRGLFRSGMKETESNSVSLREISGPMFRLILDVLYSSADVVTEENVFDLWSASHQLQIHFLIAECEAFVIDFINPGNCDKIFDYAKMLESKKVLTGVGDFIIKNYHSCIDSETILKLDGEEFLKIVASPKLMSDSEDSVVDLIISWINYNPENNDEFYQRTKQTLLKRKKSKQPHLKELDSEKQNLKILYDEESEEEIIAKSEPEEFEEKSNKFDEQKEYKLNFLIYILSASRLSLASEDRLRRLYKHPYIRGHKKAQEIVFKASLYHNRTSLCSDWPASAVPRDCSSMDIVGLLPKHCGNENWTILGFSLRENKWYQLKVSLRTGGSKMFISLYNGVICVLGFVDHHLTMYLHRFNEWQICARKYASEIYLNKYSIIIHNNVIFMLIKTTRSLMKTDLGCDKDVYEVSKVPSGHPIKYFFKYKEMVLVFCQVADQTNYKTSVFSFSLKSGLWTQLQSLEGSCKKMSHFEKDNKTYIIMSDGALYRIKNRERDLIGFYLVARIWKDKIFKLLGAVSYMDSLYLFGKAVTDISSITQCQKLYKNIIIHRLRGWYTSMASCYISKSTLQETS